MKVEEWGCDGDDEVEYYWYLFGYLYFIEALFNHIPLSTSDR